MSPTSFAPPAASPATSARSFLFVPADRPDRLGKALASGADLVIADLEDAVAPGAKQAARAALAAAWEALDAASRGRLAVRINATSSPLHEADMACIKPMAASGLAAVVVPKAEDAKALAAVAAACPGTPLIALIESAGAFTSLDAIATAPQVVRLAFGHLDLQADLAMQAGEDQAELAPARWAIVTASRRANLAPPVDGVTPDLSGGARLADDMKRSLRFGFGGKLCIHPSQVAGVHEAMTPSDEQCDWARRVLAAAESAQGGAVQMDGKMVDAPVIRLAEQVLARAARN